MLSSHNLAVNKTDTLTEPPGSWRLVANADFEQIAPSVQSVIKENHNNNDNNWQL